MIQKYTGLLLIVLTMSQLACSPYKNIPKIDTMSELSYPYPVKYAQLDNDIKLAYMDKGSGSQTIIFIHGLGSYAPAWQKNIETLKNSYRCIAIDLPGYGKSSKTPHSGHMTYYAAVLMDFIDKLGIENPVLAGHSMGGQISMVAALLYPDKIGKLVLVAPAGFERFHPGQKQWFRDVMTHTLVRKTSVSDIQNNLAYNFYSMPDDAEFMITDRIAMRNASDFNHYCQAVVVSVQGMVNEPVIDKLSDIKHETLIVFGQNDNLIPNRYLNPGFTKDIAEYGASQIKNSTLKIIPKCGHFVQFEQAEKLNTYITEFLK